MAKTKSAITAIRNIKQESFVAATLHEMGWNLLYRATTTDGLLTASEKYPDALIIRSADFTTGKSAILNASLLLDDREVLTGARLQDLLRTIDEVEPLQSRAVPLSLSHVTLVATVDSGIGGSTCAINMAYEKAQQGAKTLLLDFNTSNPTFSRFFDVQHINRKISPSRFGFSLGEVSEITLFEEFAQSSNEFDEVVIDLGKIPKSEELISGRRLHEVLARWSMQSASSLFIITRSDAEKLKKLKALLSQLSKDSDASRTTILLVSQLAISGRESRTKCEKASEILGRPVRFLPRDLRAVEQATLERVPLSKIAPKSLLAQEISSIMSASSKQGR